ncbi:MAG TPA: hypothetical protein VGP72_00220 [Planctomycetota bacterium]|jgi:hypothetical protein
MKQNGLVCCAALLAAGWTFGGEDGMAPPQVIHIQGMATEMQGPLQITHADGKTTVTVRVPRPDGTFDEKVMAVDPDVRPPKDEKDGEKKGKADDSDEARAKMKEALQKRRVSFEFQDTPLEEALQFLNALGKVNMVLDPRLDAATRKTPITLKVAEMPFAEALAAVCKLGDLKWDIRNAAVFVTGKKEEPIDAEINEKLRRKLAEMNERMALEGDQGERARQKLGGKDQGNMPRLAVKLPDGTEIQADAPLLMMPGVGQQIVDRIFDPAKDGLLALRLGRDVPMEMAGEKLKGLCEQIAPKVKVDVLEQLGLVLITSDDASALRRVQTLVRALRPEGGPGKGPPPFRGPEGMDREFNPRKGGERPQKVPDVPPGQF